MNNLFKKIKNKLKVFFWGSIGGLIAEMEYDWA